MIAAGVGAALERGQLQRRAPQRRLKTCEPDTLALGVFPVTLAEGTRLGAFVISSPLGSGGMGEVYRARDTTLGRDVAIKILPTDVSANPDRLARFRREAHVLAALNHPNIATIHGIQESDGIHALVLELVEGPTLEDWIALRAARRSSSNLSLRNALGDTVAIARQIAEALDAAHERGIVHRDLKPANVKVAPDGRVKVLDFGLAKARDATETAGQPTATSLHTDAGVVLGTAPYMSPEQARGTAVDRRTDIWAFGCILYELLTGRRAFASGETASDTLAAILALDPDWSALPGSTPARLRRLVTRCLEKDPRERLRDIGDALPDLRDGPDEAAPSADSARRSDRRALVLGAVALVAAATAAYFAVTAMRRPTTMPSAAFTVQAPEGGQLTVGQPLSPDGTKLAFVAPTSAGPTMVWVRPIDSIAAHKLEGTEGAVDVFWSPDSQNLGFFAGGQLKRIPAAGGPIQVICSVDSPNGGSWGSQNLILIGTLGPLLRVSAAGGTPTAASIVNVQGNEQFHKMPEFLPDGRRFLFVVQGKGMSTLHAFLGSLDSNERRALEGVQSAVRYAATGHVLFTRDGALLAQAFDAGSGRLSGEPFQVADHAAGLVQMPFSVSAKGSLAYLTLPDRETELRWFNRLGVSVGSAIPKGGRYNAELSPDGKRVAFNRQGTADIWVLDFATGSETRVTSDPGPNYTPIWSRDNRTLLFTSYRNGFGQMFRTEIGGVAGDVLVQNNTVEQRASDWSTDGVYVVYEQSDVADDGRYKPPDLWAIAVEGGSDPIRITSTDIYEGRPRFSPDVRWVAYDSNEADRREVYVQSFPRGGHRQAVSVGGGRVPRWKPDGTELFYLTDDGAVMAVSVTSTPDGARFGPPTRLFRADVQFNGLIDRVFNVSADDRFLLDVVPAGRTPPSIVVLNDWAASLHR
jgi:Tol biopolymer transport system component